MTLRCRQQVLDQTSGHSTMVLSLTSHGAIRVDLQAEQNGRRVVGLEPFLMFGGAVPERRAEPRTKGPRP